MDKVGANIPTTIYLPFPPTVNGLYNGKVRRFKSNKYKDWIESATKKILKQDYAFFTKECEVVMSFVKPDNRKRDVANLEKAVGDFLVFAGVLADDSLIVKNTQQWVKGDFECRIDIMPHNTFTPATDYLKRVVVRPV